MEGFFGFCAEVDLSTVGADPGTGAGDGALIAGVAQDAEEALIAVGTISRAGLAAAGLVLDSIARGRFEAKRLAYLVITTD